MSAEIADRLRALAQDHHEGRLDLRAYRALRGPLLDSLATNGAVSPAMEVTQPRVAHRQMQRDAITRPGKPRVAASGLPDASPGSQPTGPRVASSGLSDISPSLQATGPQFEAALGPHGTQPRFNEQRPAAPLVSSRRLHQIAVSIAIAIVLVIAGALWAWFDRNSVGHNGLDGNASGSNAAASPPGAVKNALEPFMDSGDWGEGRLTTLNATLMELGGQQIAAVAHEPWFQRFVDELRRRLKEQQALSPTTLTVDNSPLAALAVTVGLDLNSPDSALHISAIPPASPVESAPAATRSSESAATQRRATEHSNGPAAGTHDADSPSQTATDQPGGSQAGEGAGDTANAGAHVAVAANANAGIHGAGAAATATNADACRPELIHSRRPLCHDSLPTGAEAPLMALVPAGAFDMGSTAAPEEQPVHHVTIGEAFAVSVYEVSQGEFKQYCEATHRQCASQPWQGDDYPVVNVSWDDARAYAEWLSSVTHHHYSLPTEAQWEYAARAGNPGLFPSGTSLSPTDANFSMLKKQTDAARRSQKFNANAFRLVHTVGNVREWVEDPWSQTFAGVPNDGTALKSTKPAMRVVRGGSYMDGSARLRLSMRESLAPDTRDVTTGFRIVRELP
jgi:formylglycine-generating enzyme required for sulfatase activity